MQRHQAKAPSFGLQEWLARMNTLGSMIVPSPGGAATTALRDTQSTPKLQLPIIK